MSYTHVNSFHLYPVCATAFGCCAVIDNSETGGRLKPSGAAVIQLGTCFSRTAAKPPQSKSTALR